MTRLRITLGLLWGLTCATAMGCGSEVTPSTPGAGGMGGQGGGDGTCTVDQPCAEGACFFPPDSCAASTKGICQVAFNCDGPPSGPICGCDGEVIEGEYADCDNNVPYFGTAEACAKGTFACGTLQCKRNVELCVVTIPGVPNSDPMYECRSFTGDITGTCKHGIADCSCLDTTALGCPDITCCAADADKQETITIPLP